MVTRTRYEHRGYDNTVYYRNLPSQPSWSVGWYGVESHDSYRTADYPDWDWKAMIKAGQNAITVMQAERLRYGLSSGYYGLAKGQNEVPLRSSQPTHVEFLETYYSAAGTILDQRSQQTKGYIDRMFLTLYEDPTLFARVNNQALMKFNEKCLKAQQDLNGLVALGELGQTLKMIHRSARSIRNGLTSYLTDVDKSVRRNKNRKNRKDRIMTEASDLWLEYSFGWKPLYADIDDGCKALANTLYAVRDRKFVSAIAEDRVITAGTPLNYIISGNVINYLLRERRRYYVSVRYYGLVGAPQKDVFSYSRSGLTSSEFIPTIWELIPYSFLVDYFSNVGEIIQAFSHGSYNCLWVNRGICTISESYWEDVAADLIVVPPYVDSVQYWSPGTRSSYSKRNVSRAQYSGTRIPSLEFQVPGMSTKWINMSALLFTSRKVSASIRG